jgi:hypothetical protein|tara:strand:+ start:1089 stop:1832 length:744 start_codon:yes stop_codon:yes gene_type:complete
MYIDRQEIVEELRLRKIIRQAIQIAEMKTQVDQTSVFSEEERLRGVIKTLLREDEIGDTNSAPYDNTGLNTLNTLFDNILTTVESGYKELTTSKEQRDSFSAHVLKAIENVLAPLRALDGSDRDISEEIGIDISKDQPEDMIDVRKDKEEQDIDDFSIEGQDLSGRDKAYEYFNKVETQIVDAYKTLHNPEDIKAFYDGLLMNLDLYFQKFEDEMQPTVEPPETGAEEETGMDDLPDDTDLADIAEL